jgi:hypothetical protein
MLTCPMCKNGLRSLERECPRCRADLSLLVDYADHLDVGLARAEERTRAGDLAGAVWAYLEVLEVDPDNPEAKRQVGRVATVVRQFDRTAPGRRWLNRLRQAAARPAGWGLPAAVLWGAWVLTVLAALLLGFALGSQAERMGLLPAPAPASR